MDADEISDIIGESSWKLTMKWRCQQFFLCVVKSLMVVDGPWLHLNLTQDTIYHT